MVVTLIDSYSISEPFQDWGVIQYLELRTPKRERIRYFAGIQGVDRHSIFPTKRNWQGNRKRLEA
jgi:hypothetical protein